MDALHLTASSCATRTRLELTTHGVVRSGSPYGCLRLPSPTFIFVFLFLPPFFPCRRHAQQHHPFAYTVYTLARVTLQDSKSATEWIQYGLNPFCNRRPCVCIHGHKKLALTLGAIRCFYRKEKVTRSRFDDVMRTYVHTPSQAGLFHGQSDECAHSDFCSPFFAAAVTCLCESARTRTPYTHRSERMYVSLSSPTAACNTACNCRSYLLGPCLP